MIPSTLFYIQVVADGAGVATLGAAQLAIQTSLELIKAVSSPKLG